MSRQLGLPPPPPGLPARPMFDSYRPPASPTMSRYPSRRSPEPHPRDNNNMYEPRGNGFSNRDESRAHRRRSRSPAHCELPPGAKPGGDSYRPPSGGFNFRMEAPPSLDMRQMSDLYRPPPVQKKVPSGPKNSYARAGNNRSHANGARHDQHGQHSRYRGAPSSRKAAERPFLQSNRAPTPELMQGMEEDDGAHVKYLALEDLSDSEEADMELSSDEGEKETVKDVEEGPRMKQARTTLNASSDGDSVPKWSNPDPYTALPPVEDSQRKKLDVVKLIRKARVVSSLDGNSKKGALADDFISFDLNEENETGDTVVEQLRPGVTDSKTIHPEVARKIGSPAPEPLRKPEWLDATDEQNDDGRKSNFQPNLDISPNPALGSRKRNHEDEIKEAPYPRRSGPLNAATSGEIVREWRAIDGVFDAPWCTVDHAASKSMSEWLHMEIMDFYDHFRATDFEDSVRCDLITRLRTVASRKFPNAEIHPFGSFVAGLYLPTADMDVVLCSKRYLDGGSPVYGNSDFLFVFRDLLVSTGLAKRETVEVIRKAKVPLVKYVDSKTGLRVDLSFENDTGLVANKTFKKWKADQPAMPILVTLIKQFLSMRRLNEPVNGGIGGFTVTCLVMSLLQLMPQVQSGNMVPEHHLGEVLMEFLDLYGNEFNCMTTAIQFNPPAYISKHRTTVAVYQHGRSKFCIIDPNNSRNDIAGGSKNTATIVKAFSDAYKVMQKTVQELHALPIEQRRGRSMLSAIIGGNYSSFYEQRERLRMYHQAMEES